MVSNIPNLPTSNIANILKVSSIYDVLCISKIEQKKSFVVTSSYGTFKYYVILKGRHVKLAARGPHVAPLLVKCGQQESFLFHI